MVVDREDDPIGLQAVAERGDPGRRRSPGPSEEAEAHRSRMAEATPSQLLVPQGSPGPQDAPQPGQLAERLQRVAQVEVEGPLRRAATDVASPGVGGRQGAEDLVGGVGLGDEVVGPGGVAAGLVLLDPGRRDDTTGIRVVSRRP